MHPGRLQYVRPNLLIDGAHNRAGIQALSTYIDDSIRAQRKKIITLFGTSKREEEVAGFVDVLIAADEHVFVHPSVHRGLDPDLYVHTCSLSPVSIQKNPVQAVQDILSRADEDTLIVVYGSLYLLGEVLG